MKKRIFSIFVSVFILIGIVGTPVLASSPVNIFNITVTPPHGGQKPVNAATLPEKASTYVADVRWEGELDGNGSFKVNSDYTVYVTVRIKDGLDKYIKYIKSTVKINENIASMKDISDDKQQAVIYYTFKTFGNEALAEGEISASDFEWEVLRLTNIERAKLGIQSLSMPAALQNACDIRAVEIESQFSHARPDGSSCFTVIPSSFPRSGTGENIAKGQRTPLLVVDAWMNSSGHRANITNWGFGYMGVGHAEKMNTWVQLFANRGEIVDCKVSTDERSFSPLTIKNVYLILTDENGIVSHMPLSFDAMVKENGKYKPRINAKNLPEFTNVLEDEDVPVYVVPDPDENNIVQESTGEGFVDVPSNAYYAEGVEWAVENGITNGTSANTFSPDNTCTRAQIITFIWRAVGTPQVDASNPFKDVKKSDYFYDAAIWAYKKGIISGTTFAPETPCTRASTVEYLWKNANAPSTSSDNSFSDVFADSELSKAVSWAVANGITSGTSETTFSPEATCTRGQIVTFLIRAFN